MEDNKIHWRNLANQFSELRAPKFNLKVFCMEDRWKVSFDTLVPNKKRTLLTLARQEYEGRGQFDFDTLVIVKDRFLDNCDRIQNHYIYNKDTAVEEPYEFNKRK